MQLNTKKINDSIKKWAREFPDGPVGKTSKLPVQGVCVRSLVGELRSHMLHGATTKINK